MIRQRWPIIIVVAVTAASFSFVFRGPIDPKPDSPALCNETNTLKSDSEIIHSFIERELLEGGRWWRQVGSKLTYEKENHELVAEFSPFQTVSQYLKLAPESVLLKEPDDRELPEDSSVWISVKDIPQNLSHKYRSRIVWWPSARFQSKSGMWSVVHWYSGPEQDRRLAWLESWVDHCGNNVGVPIEYVVG